MRHRSLQFLQGLFSGILISVMVLIGITLYLQASDQALQLHPRSSVLLNEAANWVIRNLGYSLIPFTITLMLYVLTLQNLSGNLDQNQPVEKIAQGEHLLEVWISLFFGIGVIWTAIGMRGALLYALGDVTHATGSAIQVLARMVDGGMLTALSTTILGGAGGYLMRLGKSLSLEMKLSNYYSCHEQQQRQRIEILLSDIKHSINPGHAQQSAMLQHESRDAC
jgi:hypothetical protein